MTPLLAVVGPTASGKSELALRICEQMDGELVSADSVQLYRHFDIGTAKPSPSELGRVRHHLVDVLDPLDGMDVARFVESAELRIEDIVARGKRPVVCGGSFLWVRALIYGLAEAPPANEEIRRKHREEAERHGRAHLHAQLRAIDPTSHARLGENDLVRVSRALEVYELTGKPLSEIQAGHGFRVPRRPARLIGIERERQRLRARIEQRVHHMLERGWLDEVRALLGRGYRDARAMGSVGYRQIREALDHGAPINHGSLAERVVQATNAFARHQMTWLRSQSIEWIRPESTDAFLASLQLAPGPSATQPEGGIQQLEKR